MIVRTRGWLPMPSHRRLLQRTRGVWLATLFVACSTPVVIAQPEPDAGQPQPPLVEPLPLESADPADTRALLL